MDTEEFNKQFNNMKAKALKYDNMSKRYSEIATKLKKIGSDIDTISKEIDPFLNVKKQEDGQRQRQGSMVEISKEVYEKCIGGVEIGRKFLESAYPGYTKEQYNYILQTVQAMPNIDKRREGMYIILYAKKDTFRGN